MLAVAGLEKTRGLSGLEVLWELPFWLEILVTALLLEKLFPFFNLWLESMLELVTLLVDCLSVNLLVDCLSANSWSPLGEWSTPG